VIAGLLAIAPRPDTSYLLRLGVQALLAARRGEHLPMGSSGSALVLYLSVLPQYLQPGLGVGATLLLVSTLGVLGACRQLGLLFAGHRERMWLGTPKIRRALDGVLGRVLIAFGVGLAAE
jgi:hypothetical protein